MLFRFLFALLCLGFIAGYVACEQAAGRLQWLDEAGLDFMIANARERFAASQSTMTDAPVALVTMKEAERDEYAGWPPPPLDWQTVLKALKAHQPSVLVVATPLNWGQPTPDFVPAVAEALLHFPSVILGVEALRANSSVPAILGDQGGALPRFHRVTGDPSLAPKVATLSVGPDPALRARGELGPMSVHQVDGHWSVPYALSEGDTLLPTLLAQTLARQSQTAYAWHHLRLGTGAGAHLRDGRFVPLEADGALRIETDAPVPEVNALELMAGDMAGEAGTEEREKLGQGKVIVIGLETTAHSATPSPARLYAQALQQVLRMPRLRILTFEEQVGVWALFALVMAWMVSRVPRRRAIRAGLLIGFFALVASYLAFQAGLIWCPPTMPVALLAVGIIVGRLLGRRTTLLESSQVSTESTPSA